MALPITVPYTFGNATTAIPLSNLDSDYATVYQAVNGIGNGSVALANVTITGGTVSNVSGVVPTPFTANGVVYASSTSALATGSGLVFDGTNLGLGVTPVASVYTPSRNFFVGQATNLIGRSTINFTSLNTNVYEAPSSSTPIYINSSTAVQYVQYLGQHIWNIAPSGTAGNAITFTQAMTLDTSGNLLVAKTSAGSSQIGVQLSSFGQVLSSQSASTNATGDCYDLYSTGASQYRFYVGMGGTVYATSTTISAISDQRLKENIRDLDDGLASVMALKPRKFDWKEGKGADIKNARGFIAQEFETVFPDMIEEWKDPAPEGEEPYKAVNANLIPTLVKSIQELSTLITAQSATIQSLTERITALEGART